MPSHNGTKTPVSKRRSAFNLPPQSLKKRIEAKPGLEPLRDGDDVNLNSESEDAAVLNTAARSKDANTPAAAASTAPPRTQSKDSSAARTESSTGQAEGQGGQTLLVLAIVVLLIMLLVTSAATVVVVLHWSGMISWIPALTAALQE